MKKYIKENKKTIIIVSIASLLFILLSTLLVTNKINNLDTITHSYILSIRNNTLTKIFTNFTNLANGSFLLAISVILLILMKNKKIPLYMLINLICAFLTNETAKSIFNRTRPIGINLVDEIGLSYPSGHSMVGLTFYGFILYLIYQSKINKSKKIIITTSLIITILIIGISRIYLGVHYLSDVIGGFLLAIIYLTIFINIIKIEKK